MKSYWIITSSIHYNSNFINNSRLYIDNQLQNQIVISDITEIKAYAFYDCDFIESATISNGVTKIGSKAFYGCDSLRTIVIPKSVVNIENDAFSNCTSLERVDYLGTMDDWKNINFENNSSNPLSNKNAKLYVDGVLAQQKNIVLENSFVIKSDKGYFYPNASFP